MTTLAITYSAFAKDTLLDGAKLDSNFTSIKDFLNCTGATGIDATTNLNTTLRIANNQLAEPHALISSPTLVVAKQTDVAFTAREYTVFFHAPCDMVLVELAVNVCRTGSGEAEASVGLDCSDGGNFAIAYFDDGGNNKQAIVRPAGKEASVYKEGSLMRLIKLTMNAQCEFLTARATFKAQHTGR